MSEASPVEHALVRVARTLAAAPDIEQITTEITRTAIELTGASGAYVERVISRDGDVDVIATAGEGTPPHGTVVPYPGSLTEDLIESGEPLLMETLVSIGPAMAPYLQNSCDRCGGLIVPLLTEGDVVGCLILLRHRDVGSFDERDAVHARLLGDLASVALKRVAREADVKARHEHLMQSKSRLIRGFSHDIKNPLGAADGYAQLLLDGLMGELTQKQMDALERIRRSISMALELINDVVEFSRAEAGQIEVRAHPFSADALVREVVEEHRAAATQAGVDIEAAVVEGGDVICDAIRIRQILGNLVTNAIKYGGSPGAVQVEARRINGVQPRVIFSVADRGPGIPPEKMHLLFEEFQRLHTGQKEGSGLGLAISRRVARVLGGDIEVESTPGAGARFTLWIPAPRQP